MKINGSVVLSKIVKDKSRKTLTESSVKNRNRWKNEVKSVAIRVLIEETKSESEKRASAPFFRLDVLNQINLVSKYYEERYAKFRYEFQPAASSFSAF